MGCAPITKKGESTVTKKKSNTDDLNSGGAAEAAGEEEPTLGRKLFWASLGTCVVARREGRRVFEYLVEQGSPFDEPVRQKAKKIKKDVGEDLHRAGEAVGRSVGKIFGRYAAPAEGDIKDLANKVDDLGKRVEKATT